MSDYAHLEDTRQPAEHDEDAEEPTMITGLRGNPDEEDYDSLKGRGNPDREFVEYL